MFYKHFKKMNVNVLSQKCLKGKMNNKSLSKIYNVKYMDYPDFLIHILKVLSSIFIELMCKRIKFVIIGFFLKHLMDGYFLYVMVHSILYFYVILYLYHLLNCTQIFIYKPSFKRVRKTGRQLCANGK